MDETVIIDAIRTRRSIRKFSDRDISDDTIMKALEAGRWAPSGLNNQPWRFVIINNMNVKNELASYTKYTNIVEKCSMCIVVYYDIESGYHREKDILGIWVGEAESSKFWMKVLADLKNRGVKDILIACVDGLKGFEEAIKSTFSETEIQQCIVHQIRNSTKFVNYKDRKKFCADMK